MAVQRRVKSVEQSLADTMTPEHQLKKNLSAWDLTIFGVAVVVGAGIFTLGAKVAATKAGPSVSVGFLIAALACALAAVCYAEFASTVPVAGSAYTFSYATLGEVIAWIIGWDLLLELALGAAVVAKAWSAYLGNVIAEFGGNFSAKVQIGSIEADWGAILIVFVLAALLIAGTKISARTNAVVTAIKVGIVLLVIVVGFFYFKASNLSPFVPPKIPAPAETASAWHQPLVQSMLGLEPTSFGVFGIFAAASIVFFAFIGFDIVATAAEETKNPQRDLPRGILGSLVIVTVLYVLVTVVVTGMVRYDELGADATLATAFSMNGVGWAAKVIAIGALAGLTTVVMVLLLGQSRIIFAMARDGLIPRRIATVSPRTGTPVRVTIGVAVVVAVLAGFVDTSALEEMVNVGTLFAFVLVSIGVIVLRRTRPDLPRGFRVPLVPWVPILSVAACVWLMLNLTGATWVRFGVWMVLGAAVYLLYGRSHSRVGQRADAPPPASGDQDRAAL